MRLKIEDEGYIGKPDETEKGHSEMMLRYKESTEIDRDGLRRVIKEGKAFILANFKDDYAGTELDNIESIPAIALVFDGKEYKTNLPMFVKNLYNCYQIYPSVMFENFGGDSSEFTAILELERPISLEKYEKLYEGLYETFAGYLEEGRQANSLVLGTNTKVLGCSDITKRVMSEELIERIIANRRTPEEKARIEAIKHKENDEIIKKVNTTNSNDVEILVTKKINVAEIDENEKKDEIPEVKEEAEVKEKTYKLRFTNERYKAKPSNFGIVNNILKATKPVEITATQLVEIIERGDCFYSSQFNDEYGVGKENIIDVPLIGLDVDKKPITIQEFTEMIHNDFKIRPIISYPTFSDDEKEKDRSFRLLYEFKNNVSGDELEEICRAFVLKYPNWLDKSTINSNRLWAGTNKKCIYNPNHIQLTEEVIKKIKACIPPKKKPVNNNQGSYKNTSEKPVNQIYYEVFQVAKGKGNDVVEILNNNIKIADFFRDKYGVDFKSGKTLRTNCPIHGGSNKFSFAIFEEENTFCCFSCKAGGDIIKAAKKYYNEDEFSKVVYRLMNDYNVHIPKEYITIRGRR